MAAINLMRTDKAMPEGVSLDYVRSLLFDIFDGFNRDDKRAWRSLWRRLIGLEPGEMALIEARLPRSGPYHRRHFALVNAVFEAQERVKTLEQFVVWIKIGSGWVDWMPGAKGGIVPIPKSISYQKADQAEFTRYHEAVVEFLKAGHAARFLWKHLGDGADEMMDAILTEFDE